ncbi:MAG TPA: HEAT repeat domain-containing protein [Myxococcota bacterium]|jgi:serine/threonine-protein kinase|nr:HEAT repeat domain-containing protein [Myxococcota bacterium]
MLGNYRILDFLGEGGMGMVFLAEHIVIKRRAALKVLRREMISDETLVARFEAEARAVNEIGHKSLVDVFDVGRTPDRRLYMVMELLQGETLADRMKAGPMLTRAAVGVVSEVARALAAAHAKGFVHRDVKPENIFLAQREGGGPPAVKLLDFGVAKLAGLESAQDRLTRTGVLVGSPAYMSPEQIEGVSVDGRSDVYSLGAVLYELLAGSPPFRADTIGQILRMHMLVRPRPLAELAPASVPRGLNGVVMRALAKEREERYASMDELIAAIDQAMAGSDPEASYVAQVMSAPSSERITAVLPQEQAATSGAIAAASTTGAGAGLGAGATTQMQAPRRSRLPVLAAVAGGVVALAAVGGFVAVRLLSGGDEAGEDDAPRTSSARAVPASAAPATAEPGPDLKTLRTRAVKVLTDAVAEGEPDARAEALRKMASAGEPGAAELARGLLGDPDAQLRAAAAWSLGRMGATDANASLGALIGGADPFVAVFAAEALARLGDEGGRKALRAALKDAEPAVVLKAALALAEQGDDKAVKPLRAALAAGGEAAKRSVVLPILGALTRLGDGDARAALVAMLADTDEVTRLGAAEVLARLGDDAGRPALSAIARDGGSPNRVVAARVLLAFGDPDAAKVIGEVARDAKAPARATALEALGELGDPAAAHVLEDALDDEPAAVRLSAAAAVLTLVGAAPEARKSKSVDWVNAALAADDWAVRDAATSVLAELDPEVAVPLLGKAAKDENATVRRSAARALGRTHAAAAVPMLAEALHDAETAVGAEAARALGDLGDRRAVPDLTAVAAADTVVGVHASGALVKLGEGSAVKNLEAAVEAKDATLRLSAVEAAGHSGDAAAAVPVLKMAADDRAFEVRFRAASALALFGDASGVDMLKEGLKKPELAAEALAALKALGVDTEGLAGPSIEELLGHKDASVRRDAVASAAALPPADALRIVQRAIYDLDVTVRMTALDVLAGLVAKDRDAALAVYRAAARDANPVVANRANAALARLLAPPPAAVAAARAAAPATAAPATAAPESLPASAAPESAAASAAPATATPESGTASPAGGSSAPSTTEAEAAEMAETEARDHETKGNVLLAAGKYAAAAKELKAAATLRPTPPTVYNLAEAYRLEGLRTKEPAAQAALFDKAKRYYEKFLKTTPSGPKSDKARGYIGEMAERLGGK